MRTWSIAVCTAQGRRPARLRTLLYLRIRVHPAALYDRQRSGRHLLPYRGEHNAQRGRIGPFHGDPVGLGEVAWIGAGSFRHVHSETGDLEDRRGALAHQAAGHDPGVEDLEVAGQVEGEAVAGDGLVQLHADGRHFGASGPDAGHSGSARLRGDSQGREVGDQRLLEAANMAEDVAAQGREVKDRVADQLAWTVVGRISAPVGPDQLDPSSSALLLAPEQV